MKRFLNLPIINTDSMKLHIPWNDVASSSCAAIGALAVTRNCTSKTPVCTPMISSLLFKPFQTLSKISLAKISLSTPSQSWRIESVSLSSKTNTIRFYRVFVIQWWTKTNWRKAHDAPRRGRTRRLAFHLHSH